MFQKRTFLILAVCLLLTANFAFGQGTTGQISGTVFDPNGALVQGASVKLTNLETNLSRDTVTNDEGAFSFQLLPPARYSVEISAQGFAAYKSEAVVNITQTTVIEANLSVTGGDTVVNVEAPILQVETSQNGRVVTGETIRQLPLPTRNFQQLLTLSPGAQSGVSNTTDLGRGDAVISVNGQRTTSNSVRINGVDANSIGTNSTPNIAVPATDSLQEFIVQTSLYDASNGRNSGGNVEAVTKSGTNEFNGSAYYFLRNRRFNANEPFIKARGIERPILNRNQFGGTFGGPVIKDRLFFFTSYQGTREKNGMSLTNSLTSPIVPAGLTDSNRTAAGLAATFGISVANISPVAVNILNAKLSNGQFAIPSSGSTNANPLAAIVVPQSGVSEFRENQFNFNGDYVFTEKHNLSAKFFIADNPTTQANYNFAGLGNGERQLIGFGGDLTIKQKLYSITDTYVFSPNIVNQARFGFNRLRVTSTPEEPFTAASLGITSPNASQFPGAPTIRVLGLDSAFFFGSGTLADQSSRINGYNISDTLSVTAGNHRLKFGGEYRASTVKFYFNAFSRGQLLFASFRDFLTGGSLSFATLTNGLSLIGSGTFDRSFRVKDASGFIQDDWKINNRLTVNLGLRYDLYGLPVDVDGRLVNLDLAQIRTTGTAANPATPPNGLVQAEGGKIAGIPTVTKTLVPVDKNNFGPRVGFAYLLDEKLNLVMRAGYGIYYDRISTRYANSQLFNYPYFTLPVSVVSPIVFTGLRPFSNPFFPVPPPSQFPLNGNIPTPTGAAVSGVFVDPELVTPYIQQFNVGFQMQVFDKYLLDVGYVGNKGTNLLQVITLNQPVYNRATNTFTSPLGANFAANKNVTGGVQQIQTTSLSTYNSLQASVTRRFSNGVQFLAAYTFGKSIDYYSGAALNELANVPGDQVNWRSNRGRSDFNREQRFVISGVYDLPKFKDSSKFVRGVFGNWEVASIAVFQSGLPFSIETSNGTGLISRANYNQAFTGDLYTNGSVGDRLNGYFNTAAFVPSCPQVVTVGTPPVPTTICTGAYTSVNNPSFDPNAPFGNSQRNLLTGPGQKNVDISFIKFIPFNERFRGEFRVEAFNVFNWVNYANPNNNISGANFGRIERAATGPRVVQLAFKLGF
ncbi:MAG: TonB-dependent receptor [Pyrinomonadaceae bacterium]|nr:TonB-dependent receptor [Pyrinomonadaceae bacterium]